MTGYLDPDAPIGVFDSGLGGLAVLREIQQLLPHEDVLFLGDTARQPYGPRPVEVVRRFAIEITGYLIRQGVKMVIIACNTASVAGREAAQKAFPGTPVLGMIEPGVQAALKVSQSNRIGVWGTALTVGNKAYDRHILRYKPDIKVHGAACPELLRLAEKGQIDDRAHLLALARKYYQPLAEFQADTLILGCTDLTCVRDVAEEVVGEGVIVVDPAEEVVRVVRQRLKEMSRLRNDSERNGRYQFLITGDDEANFAAFTARFMGLPEVRVTRVPLSRIEQVVTNDLE